MDLKDAAYHTVHDCSGGAEVLALRLGKGYKTLLKEVSPTGGEAAKFGLLDASKIMALTKDFRILHAMCLVHGFLAVPLPHLENDDGPCAKSVAQLAGTFAELMSEVAEDLADNAVSDNEVRDIEEVCGRLMVHVQQLLQQVMAMNQVLKARHAPEMRGQE